MFRELNSETGLKAGFLFQRKCGEGKMEKIMQSNLSETTMGPGIDLDQVDAIDRRKVLVVEDEVDTIFLLKQLLRIAGFNVLGATNGQEAIKKVMEYEPDLVLLDLMMPEMDGWETMQHMRKMSKVPVIIISALGAKEDVVGGLKKGADDYIPKPFFNAEVIERVKAVLRRAGKPKEISRLVFPQVDLVIDLLTQEVVMNGKTIRLTPKEFAILAVLAKHSPAIVSYETIGDAVWGEDSAEVRRRTKYLIYLLRKKFAEISPKDNIILNFDRLGYKLLTED